MRIIILGGNAAGMSAAAKIRRINPEAEVVVYEKRDYISFGACGLPYYVGDFFEDAARMVVRTPEQAAEMGIELHLKQEVIKVDPENKQVQIRDLATNQIKVENYDQLMVATGASAVVPPITNVELDHVYMLRTLEDGMELKKKFMDVKIHKIGIVGAGFIGLELVEAARNLGKEVIVFQSREHVLNDVFDPEITEIIEEELRAEGVKLYLNARVVGFEGDQAVKRVITDKESVDVDLVIVAAGVRPNTAFMDETEIERLINGAIIVDQQGKTSIPDIYAAGDCAAVTHMLRKDPVYQPLATNANKLGRVVGENLAGVEQTWQGTLGSSCLKVLSIEAGCTGLREAEARAAGYSVKTKFITDKNQTDYYPGQEKVSVKLIYEEESNILLGGQVVGKKDAVLRTNVLATAIYAKMTTGQLGMLDLCYAPPFARTWDVLNIAGNAAK